MSLARKVWRPLAKAIVLAAILGWLARQMPLAGVVARLAELTLAGALLAIGIALAQIALGGLRWWRIARTCGAGLPLGRMQRVIFISMFFNQMVPGMVGSDASRVVMCARAGVSASRALIGVAVDRAFALIALGLLVMLSFPWLAGHMDARLTVVLELVAVSLVLGACAAALGSALFRTIFGRWRVFGVLCDLLDALRACCRDPATLATALSTSIVSHALSGATVIVLAWSLAIPLDPLAGTIVMLPCLLAMALPISIAGWGVREGAMILALGQIGVAPVDALSLSVLFGLTGLAAALPGAALWMTSGARAPEAPLAQLTPK